MRVCLLLLWGLVAASTGGAVTFTENFSADPQQNGWKVFGDTNLFQWDSLNQNLGVTWDSSQTNSYFYHPLATILARDDDFTLSFDLQLNDVETTGYGFEIAVSLLSLANATSTNFDRGAGVNPATGARNVMEFDYFPAPDDATISPTIISSNNQFATVFVYPLQLTNGVRFHISMAYAATNQTLSTTITDANHQAFAPIDDVHLGLNFSDFRLDAVAVSSYNGASDPYDTTLAHGFLDNLAVTAPPPPVQNLAGRFTNKVWQAQFLSRSNWVYTLERTTDFQAWINISPTTPGNGTDLFLEDITPPSSGAFYRVGANRP